MARQKTEWWREFFPYFQNLFDITVPGDAAKMTSYIIRKLGLKAGDSFLDCPCGNGRISIPLAKKGIKVSGVDITRSYLDKLSQGNKKLKLPVKIIEMDMRRINFDSQFDAAGNIWTSFGYFDKESDNQLVLNKLYKALKPGGKMLLHVLNRDWIIKHYTPYGLLELGDLKVVDKRRFDCKTSINISQWHFFKSGHEEVYESRIRMYSWHELYNMMQRAGFQDVQGYGSMNDDQIDFNSQNLFVIGTKKR